MKTTNEVNNLDTLPGEELPSINEKGSSSKRRAFAVLVVLGLFVVAVAIGFIKWRGYQKTVAGGDPKNLQLASSVPQRTFAAPPSSAPVLPGGPAPMLAPTDAAAPLVPAPDASAPPLPGGAPVGATGAAKPTALLDKSGSSLMTAPTGGGTSAPGSTPGSIPSSPAFAATDGAGGAGRAGDGNSLAALLNSTPTASRRAGTLGDRNFVLAKGSFINCALQTRLDSTIPGMTSCVVTRNIYSDNGKVLLIERGSTVAGEYQANVRQGMKRIFVLWDRIKTPSGVVVRLESPATDPLGGAGLPGHVNNHFWTRFGGALLLSLVDDVAASATREANGPQNFNSTGEAAQSMAAEALKSTVNIPPTLYKNQGEEVGIYVARDLDFSGVYRVQSE